MSRSRSPPRSLCSLPAFSGLASFVAVVRKCKENRHVRSMRRRWRRGALRGWGRLYCPLPPMRWGGGGGSFDAGTNQILVADFQTGDGEVIITELAAAVPEPAVRVAVEDSGPGQTPAAHEHLFEAFLHDQAQRFGDGAVDLSFDHRSSWRTIVGDRKRAPRRCLSIHGAYLPRRCIVIGRPALRKDQPGARRRWVTTEISHLPGSISSTPTS